MERVIAKELRCDLFATHKDIGQSIAYLEAVIKNLPAKETPAVLTAVQSFINTIIEMETQYGRTE